MSRPGKSTACGQQTDTAQTDIAQNAKPALAMQTSSPFSLRSNIEAVPLHFAQFKTHSQNSGTLPTKRGAPEDLEENDDKRVKASHDLAVSQDVILPIEARLNPNLLPIMVETTRLMAGDSMTKKPSNNVTTDPAPLASARVAPLAPPNSVTPDMFATNGTAVVPAFPLDAIGTLQQASAAMLGALVNKDEMNREKQLLVAVGTIRTCLDVHFVPHVETWKEYATGVRPVGIGGLVSGKDRKQLSILTSGPPPGTPTGPRDSQSATSSTFLPANDALRQQLATARATVLKQEQMMKDNENELARSKEENKRLTTHLAKAKNQPQKPPQSIPSPIPDLSNALVALNKVVDEQTGKIERQKKYINEMEAQNAKLVQKAIVTPPPTPITKKVESQVVALNKTIKELREKNNRQRNALSKLERQNAELRKHTTDQPTQGKFKKQKRAGLGSGRTIAVLNPIKEQSDPRLKLEKKTGGNDGPAQRQLPPHFDIVERRCAGPSKNINVDPVFLRSVDNLIASLEGAAPSAGSEARGSNVIPLGSRKGADRSSVDSRSLRGRIGGKQTRHEQAGGPELGPEKEQKTHEQLEVEYSGPSHWDAGSPINPYDGNWGPYKSEVGDWGADYSAEGDWGHCEDRSLDVIPGQDQWQYGRPLGNEQWTGEDDGEKHWDSSHAQSAAGPK